MCLWKIPSFGRSACYRRPLPETKTPQRWAVTICPLQGLRISSGRSRSFLSQADVCADLFTCFLFPWQIPLIRRQVPANRKRAPHPGVIPATFRNGASLTGKAVEPSFEQACGFRPGNASPSPPPSLPAPLDGLRGSRLPPGGTGRERVGKQPRSEAPRPPPGSGTPVPRDAVAPAPPGSRAAGLPSVSAVCGSHQHDLAVVPRHVRRHCFVLNQSLK